MKLLHSLLAIVPAALAANAMAQASTSVPSPQTAYEQRVELVRQTPGLVAFWDFVLRENGEQGRFVAHTARGDTHRYGIEPRNISRGFWWA